MSSSDLPREMSASAAGQISQIVQTGLPIESGLLALAEQTPSPKIKSGLVQLCRLLEQGTSLESALQSSGVELPDSMKSLVGAGIKTGRMDTVMHHSVQQMRRSNYLREQIWLSLSYPIFLFWFSALYCGEFLIFIVPQFSRIFDDLNTKSPGIAKLLIRMSAIMKIGGLDENTCGVIFVVGLIAIFIATLAGFSKRMQTRATSLPLLGRIFQYAALSDFCQLLALLMETGLPFSTALQVTGKASEDLWLNLKCQSLSEDIERGTTPEVAARNAGFPSTLAQAFHHTNSDHALVKTLRALSDIYAARCSLTSRLTNSLIGSLTVIFVTFFAGFTVIGLIVPLLHFLNTFSFADPPENKVFTIAVTIFTCLVYGVLISGIAMWIAEFSLPDNASNEQRRTNLKVGSFVLILCAIFGMLLLICLGVDFGLIGLFAGIMALLTLIESEYRTSGIKNRASQAELMWVLALAVRSGRPLAEEVEAYSQGMPKKRSQLLKEMAIRLRHGDSPINVIETDGLLPQSALMQIYSGVSAKGFQESLGKNAVRLTRELAEDQEPGPQGIALIYPAAILNIVFLICGFLMYWIIPKFKKIFDDFGTELPPVTIFLIRISDTVVNYWYLLLLPFFYVPIAVFLLVMYAEYYGWRELLRHLFGNIWIRLYSADILRLFAAGIAEGRPIDDVLSKLIQHPLPQSLRRSLLSVLDATKRGVSFWQSLQKVKLLKPEESVLLETAERTGNLPWALETLATTIESRRYFRLRECFEVLQPVALIVVALTAGFVVIALFMPLIKLLDSQT